MGINKKTSILSRAFLSILFFFSISFAQIVPFYPIEIFFCPLGYTNNLPGCDPKLYTTLSSLKIVLNKDLPSTEKFSNTVSLVSNIIKYHYHTKSRNYHPFSLNPTITSHFFASDIFTLGLDLVGNLEFIPGSKIDPKTVENLNTSLVNNPELSSEFLQSRYFETFNYQNYRFRIRPFHYVILTPNVILQQIFTYGKSYNTEKTAKLNSVMKFDMISNDYQILRYDVKAIYLTKFHTRIFLVPYYFKTQFNEIAINEKKQIDKTLPKLKEEGFGCAFGMRYMTFTWGFAEGSFEYERNFDLTYGGNSYTKLKFNAKWENQYFTERFGYLLMFDFIRHISEGAISDFTVNTELDTELGQYEIRTDIMPIFNINRNVSIRPEFDFIYRNFSDKPNSTKYRYWLHLHVLF